MFVNSILLLVSRSILEENEDIYTYTHTTGSISVGFLQLWVFGVNETNKNNIKGSSAGQTLRLVEM